MEMDYGLLVEKEEMWARMLMQVLEDHQIPCVSLPVYGAGLVMKGGMAERLKVYVPQDQAQRARELMEAVFPADRA